MASFRYDPYSLEAMHDPHRFYPELRDHHPAYYMPDYDCWAISRFADVWAAFIDAASFGEAEGQVLGRDQIRQHNQGVCPVAPMQPLPPFVLMDPPVQSRLRQMTAKPFLKPVVERLRGMAENLVDQRLDELLPKAGFDLNTDFASRISGAMIAGMVGLRADQVERMITLVNAAVTRDPDRPGFTEAGMAAVGELTMMLIDAVARRRAGEGAPVPLIDVFFEKDIEGVMASDSEIAAQLVSIVIGGAETVPKIVAGGMETLASHPEQIAAIMVDPARNVPLAVEEMLRFHAPAQWFVRTVRQERELAGVHLRMGQRVMLLVASANRDPREFVEPDAFIWSRQPRRLISFGMGSHFCIGIHLARLEIQVMIAALLKRLLRFTVDTAAGEWAVSEFQVGWTRLPVRATA